MSKRAEKSGRFIKHGIRLPTKWVWPDTQFKLEAIGRRLRFGKYLFMDEHTVRYIRGSDLTVMWEDESARETNAPWVAIPNRQSDW